MLVHSGSIRVESLNTLRSVSYIMHNFISFSSPMFDCKILLCILASFGIKRIPGVQKIRDNYNPSTWMLEVTSRSAESELGVDFAQIYRESTLYE